MPAADAVTTARMRAEPIGRQHRDGLIALLGDPRVGATMGGVRTAAEVDAQIARLAGHWAQHGFGWYAWLDRATGALIARGGLGRVRIADRDEVEVGWVVTPDRWGEGLATELGAASLEVASGPLGLDDVVAFTLPHNLASRRVMEKLGFAYELDTHFAGLPHVLYRRSTASVRSTSSSVV